MLFLTFFLEEEWSIIFPEMLCSIIPKHSTRSARIAWLRSLSSVWKTRIGNIPPRWNWYKSLFCFMTNSGLPAFPWPFWHCPFPELSRNSDRRTPLGCLGGGAPPFPRPPPRWKTSISVCERFRVSWHRSHCCPLHQPGILTNTWLLVKWIFFD